MPDDFSEMNLVAWRVEPGKLDPNYPLIEGDMPFHAILCSVDSCLVCGGQCPRTERGPSRFGELCR